MDVTRDINSGRQLLLRMLKAPRFSYVILVIALMAICASCKDEITLDPSGPVAVVDGDLVEIDLPGIMGLNLIQMSAEGTRAVDQSVDGHPLEDGSADEYALAAPDPAGKEYYHYLLFYSATDGNSKPMIFRIDVSNPVMDNAKNNITLSISKMFTKQDETEVGSNKFQGFATVADFAAAAAEMRPYVLLNFKLDDNYKSSETLTGNNTLEKLSNMSRNALEALQMTDYKIRANATVTGQDGQVSSVTRDFFIMTNSVYSSGSAKVVDGVLNPTKLYFNEETALKDPALTVHMERIAAKVTVSFSLSDLQKAIFDPKGNMIKTKVELDPETGLPRMDLTVQRVNMQDYQHGIQFDENGYEIKTVNMNATVRIIGYGLSNVERTTRLFKDINYTYNNVSWNWNDPNNSRSYWSQDPHYELTTTTGKYRKVIGYPHQFRLALDSDSVTSLHKGLNDGYADLDGSEEEHYEIDGKDYVSYNKLGTIKTDVIDETMYLSYKSFDDLYDEYQSSYSADGNNNFSFYPLYTLENTYYDPGMLLGTAYLRWPWVRAPYSAATNLVVLAEIVFPENYSQPSTSTSGDEQEPFGPQTMHSGSRDGNTITHESNVPTVYLGQNNIFYLRKVNLLDSKLAILNQVMLSGGNAGIQILQGQWDCHKTGDNSATLLDKVAWNEGSVLWFAKIKVDDQGKPIYKEYKKDDKGNWIYKPEFEEGSPYKVSITTQNISDEEIQDLDLIPAEISGGDGQGLIAPSKDRMGMRWKYYLAPASDESGNNMDYDKAVDISFNHLVALIHKIIGPVDIFKNGRMYFSVPIPHRYSNTTEQQNWSRFGGFSVVRNNWYNISVTEITRLGTPVADPTQPIVPVMDVKRSYINMGVKLLDWHVVEEDNIPLM